jgi:uncharacterized protein
MMIVKDRAYGRIEIADQLVLDLIGSAPMQRLKGINQTGATVFLEPRRNITRFEHSIGVWYILKRYGASEKEQVAGLLHDIPHTAFSHVVDFVFPNEDHTFHEKFTEKIIFSSEIPAILKKYGMEVKEILDKDKFGLLEAELPDLSADRIDYFMRDTRPDSIFPRLLINKFLNGIFVRNSKFYFKDRSLACLYAMLFMDAGRLLWLDPNSHGSYFLLARALKRAMELNRISENDFFKTDSQVFKILQSSEDGEVKKYINRLNPKTSFIYMDEGAEFTGPNKPRVVDPWVEQSGELVRTSTLIPGLTEVFERFKKTHKVLGVSERKENFT